MSQLGYFGPILCQQGSQCFHGRGGGFLIRLYPGLKRHSAKPKPKRKSGADGFPKMSDLWGFVESEVLFLLNEGKVAFQEMLAGKWALEFKLALLAAHRYVDDPDISTFRG